MPRGVADDTRRTRRWTDDDLRAAVEGARSVHDVIRRLGFEPNGGRFRNIVAHIKRLGLDMSHFNGGRGQGWARGQPLPLALDHINGDHTDNRLENLRILCPNCHALTDTWCGRNKGRRTPAGRET